MMQAAMMSNQARHPGRLTGGLSQRLTVMAAASTTNPDHSAWESVIDPTTGGAYYHNRITGATAWELPFDADGLLPPGWEAITTAEGTYYHHRAAQHTQWERPGSLTPSKSPTRLASCTETGGPASIVESNSLMDDDALAALEALRTRKLDAEQVGHLLTTISSQLVDGDDRRTVAEIRSKLIERDVVSILPLTIRAHSGLPGVVSHGCKALRLVMIGNRNLINQALTERAQCEANTPDRFTTATAAVAITTATPESCPII
jgi:hypothetical protein